MDRSSATTLLEEAYRELAADAKFTEAQTTAAYSAAIDMALRRLGTAEADLATAVVAQGSVLAYIALLHYYTLARFARLLAIKFDVKLPGPVEASRNQAYQAIKELLDQAAEECASLGYPVGAAAAGSFQAGYVTLDFQEPGLTQSEYAALEGHQGWWCW